jgi:hypothetical protein
VKCHGLIQVDGRDVSMVDMYDRLAGALIKFTEGGADNNCPFCHGRMISDASPGDRILFLKGMHAGHWATASKREWHVEREFLVHVDGASEDSERRVSYDRDRFVRAPVTAVAIWMPPLSSDGLCILEDTTIDRFLRAIEMSGRSILIEVVEALVAVVWRRRLPVTASEVWQMLQAHSFEIERKLEFCALFDFGIALLISTLGRRPIKKKRVEPMSPVAVALGKPDDPGADRQ